MSISRLLRKKKKKRYRNRHSDLDRQLKRFKKEQEKEIYDELGLVSVKVRFF